MKNNYNLEQVKNFGQRVLTFCCALAMVLLTISAWGQTTVPFISSGTWTVPAGVTEVTIEAWGGGGAGGYVKGRGFSFKYAGGGGGGAYARTITAVQSGDKFDIVVGAEGNAPGSPSGVGTVTHGEYSSVTKQGGSILVKAAGGKSVTGTNNESGAAGGALADCINGVYAGTRGSNVSSSDGGHGGSAGGYGIINGSGAGGQGAQLSSVGSPGNNYGGGGGGSYSTGWNWHSGGAGAPGYVRITYTIATLNASITASQENVCYTPGTPQEVTLTANVTGNVGTTTYIWKVGDETVGNTSAITVTPKATTKYTLVVTAENGTKTIEKTITVHTKNTANAGSDGFICGRTGELWASHVLTGDSVYSPTWTCASSDVTITNAGQANATVTLASGVTLPASRTFTWTYNNSGACPGSSDHVVVTFDDCDPAGCLADGTLIFKEDFGGNSTSDPNFAPSGLPDGITTLSYHANKIRVPEGTEVHFGIYNLIKDGMTNGGWSEPGDHTTPEDNSTGYFMEIDGRGEGVSDQFYKQTISGLCPNTLLYFTYWLINVNSEGQTQLELVIKDHDGNILRQHSTGVFNNTSWTQQGIVFTVPEGVDEVTFYLINNEGVESGNDFGLDDIEVRLCTAPVSVQINGSNPICYGSSATFEGDYEDDGTFTEPHYQWYSSADAETWTPISGATNINYTLTNATTTQYYRLAVAGSAALAADPTSNCRALSDPILLTVYPQFNAGSISNTGESICQGESPATIGSSAATGGDGTISYQWYNGSDAISSATSATYTPTVTAPGTYTFTRKAKDGSCADWTASTGSYTLTIYALPTLDEPANRTQTVCAGNAIEDITFTYTNATSIQVSGLPAGLSLSGNKITGTPTASGTYTVTTVNENGCTNASVQGTITINDPQITLNDLEGQTICDGGSTTLTASVASNNGTVTFAWSNGLGTNATSGNITSSGTYSVTATATIGSCTKTDTKSATVSIYPTFSAGAIATTGQQRCYGDGSNSQIGSTTAATGGNGSISYQWQLNGADIAGATSATYTPTQTAVGEYTFTRKAKDVSCADWTASTGSYTLTIYASPTLSEPANKTQTVCAGNAIEEITFTYTNATSIQVSGLPAGLSLSGNKITGTPTASGTYTVTTVNENGCTNASVQGTITINDPQITLNDLEGQTICDGGSTTLTASVASSNGTVTYAWSNGLGTNATSGSITSSGTYSVTATATIGSCTKTDTKSATVSIYPTFSAGAIATTGQQRCYGDGSNSQIGSTTAATGGDGNISYQWQLNGADIAGATSATYTPTQTAVGEYTFTRKAKDGSCANWTQSTGVWVLTINKFPTITVTPTDVLCNGGNTGKLAVAISGGAPSYTIYNNSTSAGTLAAAGTFNIENLAAGNYTVSVTDNNGCSVTADLKTITEPAELEVTLTPTQESCAGHDGRIDVTVNGGTGSKTYTWSNGDNRNYSDTLTSLINGGLYSVTVEDANHCSVTKQATITLNNPLSLNALDLGIICSGNEFSYTPVNGTDGNLPTGTKFTWPAPDPISGVSGLEASATGGETRIHGIITNNSGSDVNISYSVTPQLGVCVGTSSGSSVTIRQSINPPVTITMDNNLTKCPNDADFTVTATLNGVNSVHDVVWKLGGATGTAIQTHSNVDAATNTDSYTISIPNTSCDTTYIYRVEYSDATGCSASDELDLRVKVSTWSINSSTYPAGAATVECPSNASDPSSFAPTGAQITDGCGQATDRTLYSTFDIPNPLVANGTRTYTYRYTACDGSYNDWTYTYTVIDTEDPTITSGFSTTATAAVSNCIYTYPDLTETIRAYVSDNCTLASALTITQLPVAGEEITLTNAPQTLPVTITVKDAAGNTETTTIDVTVPAQLSLAINSTNSQCYNTADGIINYTISGGAANYTAALTGTATGNNNHTATGSFSFNSLADGNYTITVTDNANCQVSGNATIAQIANTLNITANTNTWTYDGSSHSDNGYTVTFGSESKTGTSGSSITLDNGDKVTATISGSISTVTASPVANTVGAGYTVMRGTDDVTCYYNITTTNGELKMTARAITITAASATKLFDGTALTKDEWTLTSGTLASGDAIDDVTITGTQTAVGSSNNVPTNAVILNGATNVTGNYSITYANGTLTVSADTEDPCIGCDPSATDPTDPTAGVSCSSITSSTGNKDVNTDTHEDTYTHSGTGWDVTAYDNVAVTSLTYTLSGATTDASGTGTSLNGIKFNVGTTTVTWTAVDPSGNEATCSFTVTVTDNQDPIIGGVMTPTPDPDPTAGVSCTSIGNQTKNTDANEATYTHSGTDWDVTAYDNVGIASLTYTLTGVTTGAGTSLNGVAFNVGTTTVTWTAKDAADRTATCSFTVTVSDDQDPIIGGTTSDPDPTAGVSCTSIGNQTKNTDANEATYTHSGTDWDVTAYDNVGIASLTYTLTGVTTGAGTSLNGVAFNVGTTTVTWTAKDAADRTATCSFTVTVSDNQDPIIGGVMTPTPDPDPTAGVSCTSIGNQSKNTDTDEATYTHSGTNWDVTAYDNVGIASLTYTLSGATTGTGTSLNGVAFNPGTTVVTWTAKDAADRTATCTFNVVVTDNQAPCIGCDPTDPINPLDPTDPDGVDCSDIGDQNKNTDAGVGTYTHSGTDWDVTASDNVAVTSLTYTLTGETTGTGNSLDGVAFNVGTTTVTWTAKDAQGNSSTCTFKVTVTDDQDPIIGGTATDPDPTAGVSCSSITSNTGNVDVNTDANASTYTHNNNDWNVTAFDNDGISSITYTLTGATSVIIGPNTNLNGQVFNVGVTTVAWTAKDNSDRTATCSFTVTVIDNQDPIIGGVMTPTPDPDPTAGVSCNSITSNTGNVDVYADTEEPSYTHTDNSWNVTAYDNVGITSLTYTLTGVTTGSGTSLNGVAFNIGITTVTWTAKDAKGNSTDCSFTVNVIDDQDPCIGCDPSDPTDPFDPAVGITCSTIGNQNVGTDLHGTVYTHNNNNWNITANDNSGVPTITYTMTGATTGSGSTLNGVAFNPGTTTVTWTATDASSNSVYCTFTVTVTDLEAPIIGGVMTPTPDPDPTAGISCASINNQNKNADTGHPYYTHIGTDWDVTAYDNFAVTSLVYELSGATTGAGTSLDGETFNLGTTTIKWTAKDALNNSSYCTFTVTVGDTEYPEITCPSGTINVQCKADIPAPYANLTEFMTAGGNATDNDGINASSFRLVSAVGSGTACDSTITRTYGVSDNSNNESTCQQIIRVKDVTAPTFTTPADITLFRNSLGAITAPIATTGDVTDESDNCATGIEATWTDLDTLPLSDAGNRIIRRQWTLYDDCNNSSSDIQEITIRPSMLTPGNYTFVSPDTTIILDYGKCDTFVDLYRVLTNNMIGMMLYESSVGQPADQRYDVPNSPYTITWRITDEDGVYEEYTQHVTVKYPHCGPGVYVYDADNIQYSTVQVGCNCWTGENSHTLHYTDGSEIVPTPIVIPGVDVNKYGYLYTYYQALNVEEEDPTIPGNGGNDGDTTDINDDPSTTGGDNNDPTTGGDNNDPTIPGTLGNAPRLLGTSDEGIGNLDDNAMANYAAQLQGVCPVGWHIPDAGDFADLLAHYEADDLKSTEDWIFPGNNSSLFTLMPAGVFNPTTERCEDLYMTTYLWSYTPGTTIFHACMFGAACSTIEVIPSSASSGYSVRCVHD